jgi:hypothetical protein
MKKVSDGWHRILGYNVYVEHGRIKYGVDGQGWKEKTVYPYRACRTGGWDIDQHMSIDAFRAAVNRETADML